MAENTEEENIMKYLEVIAIIILCPLIALHFSAWYLFNSMCNGTLKYSEWTHYHKIP